MSRLQGRSPFGAAKTRPSTNRHYFLQDVNGRDKPGRDVKILDQAYLA